MTRRTGPLNIAALLLCLPVAALANGGDDKRDGGGGLEGEDTCGASAYLDLIGQPVSALDDMSFDGRVRTIGPNQAVTMDFLPGRLNIMHDGDGTITGLRCG